MYRSFRIIEDFVEDLYGFKFLKKPMHHQISQIRELRNAYDAMVTIIEDHRKPFAGEFVEYVYPLLEVAVQWVGLKKEGKLTSDFLEKCKQRVKTQDNFYGTIFEIDMASRCLLSNWKIRFVEDYAEEGKQIDFVFGRETRHGKVAGVECLSKRYAASNLTLNRINRDIGYKAENFEQVYIEKLVEKLGIPLDEKLLIIDITTADYSTPGILEDLQRARKGSKLDAVVFTRREDMTNGEDHSLRVGYRTIGNTDAEYFSATYAAEFRRGSIFFMRKYVFPEPKVGTPYPPEPSPG